MKGAKGLPKPKPKPMQLEAKRRLGGKLNNQGCHLQEEHRKLNSDFGDVPCLVVKITHIQNKGRHIGPHLGPQGTMKKQSCNEHKKPHHDCKREGGGPKVEGKIIKGMKKKNPTRGGESPLNKRKY
jgi:hypothetical protein